MYGELMEVLKNERELKENIMNIKRSDVYVSVTNLERKLIEYVSGVSIRLDELEVLCTAIADDTSDKESKENLKSRAIEINQEHKDFIKELDKTLLD